MSDLEGHLARSEVLWKVWREHGVEDGAEFSVDFHFYSADRKRGREFAASLDQATFSVSTRETRTLLILRGLDITAAETSEWTLQRLQDRMQELHEAAEKAGVMLEGCGAEMPLGPGG